MSAVIGILGAGQLGAYLCRAARQLGLRSSVLASRPDDMAVPLADHVLYGALDDVAQVGRLLDSCDVVTFEREDVPVPVLDLISERVESGRLRVAPGVDTLRLIQNKADQKAWLVDRGIPTAPFLRFDGGLDDRCDIPFGARYVVKRQRGGYDGLGVAVVKDGIVPQAMADAPCIVEQWVEHEQEIAVLAARNAAGEVAVYPVFAMDFDARGNVLRQVVCPAGLDDRLEGEARELALQVVEALEGVGVFAVEMFVTDAGLLVNEISPRVHNVGHLTIEAFDVSQFELHVRAISALPLLQPRQAHPAAMNNLLYEPELDRACRHRLSVEGQPEGVHVHWYGKSEPRPLRKMGHLTVISVSALQAARRADATIDLLKAG